MTEYQHAALGFCLGAILVVTGVASFLVGRSAGRNGANLPVKVQVDTLVIRDTVREKYPVYVDRWKTRTELVEIHDTVRRNDTLWQAVEIERRVYQGDDYRAVVEGWRPQLAEIAVYPKTVYLQTEITQPAPPRPRVTLGFGATAGPAVIWTPEGVKFGAGIAAGLSFTF